VSPTLASELRWCFRDGVGIAGAYKKANALKPDACIELHYNAFNKVALGTETLCTVDSKDQGFAKIVHKNICVVFERGGMSRGVKVLPRSARGGGNIYAMPAYSNCLVEPFFGDNPSEAKLAQDKQSAYAKCLIYSFVEWSRSVGLINDLSSSLFSKSLGISWCLHRNHKGRYW
jgi:hypothetical protein